MQRFLGRRSFALGLTAICTYLAYGWKSGVAAAQVKMPSAPAPPIAPAVPKAVEKFGAIRIDPYDWLRDREDPSVVSYLNAENAYANLILKPIRPLLDELTAELQARATVGDASVPTTCNGYLYQRRFVRGAQYPIVVRWKDIPESSEEELVLDVGALAAGHRGQYNLGSWTVSSDSRRVAFTADFNGDGQFRVFVRTLSTGKVDDQGIGGAASNLVFGADSESLFYVRNDPITLRASQVWRHRVGSETTTDVLVYEEEDPTFSVGLDLSKSRKFVLLSIEGEHTSEVRYLATDRPNGDLKVIAPRRRGVIYEIDHAGDQFFIRTNLDAPDFRLMIAHEINPDAPNWKEIVPQTEGHYLSHFEAFETFVAVDVEDEAGTKARAFNFVNVREITVPHPAGNGVASISFDSDNEANVEPAATVLRFRFSGPLQPECVYDLDITRGTLRLRKQDPAVRWFEPSKYAIDRLEAIASDGETVPITIVYRKDLRRPGGNPTLIVGYGAYGLSMHPIFTPSVVSLLDRGFIHAIAHVRGGREKGDRWYRAGRLLKKRNTFTDFIAATERLIAQGYADRQAVFAQGGSAGGLVMGVMANLRPELYAGLVAEVPFVDVVTTMSDSSVPLTTLEYEEWGNPADKREYDYMLSYSPYDNVSQKSYPAIYVSAGFYDSQVSYAEAAKWVARLRASKTDFHDLILRTDLESGHQGRSGRGGAASQNAEIIGWLIAHVREGTLQ